MRKESVADGSGLAALLVGWLLLGWTGGGWAAPPDWAGLAWPVEGDTTNRVALGRMLPLPTGPGNACAELLKLTGLEGQPSPHPPLEVSLVTRREGSAAEQARLKQLAAEETIVRRLEVFRTAAGMGRCQSLGAAHPWPTQGHPFGWKLMQFRPILAHAAVAEQRAWDLAGQGRLAEAEAWLQHLVVTGWLLQQDLLLISNMVGITLGEHAATSLAELLRLHGGPARLQDSQRWRAYGGQTLWQRFATYVDLMRPLIGLEQPLTEPQLGQLAAIMAEPKLVRGARFEAILNIATAHLRRPGAPPASRLQRELMARTRRLEDPELRAAARELERFLDLAEPQRRELLAELETLRQQEARQTQAAATPGSGQAAPIAPGGRLLPPDFRVWVLPTGGVVNHPGGGGELKVLPTVNEYTGEPGCYVACYSRDPVGGVYTVGSGIYVKGQVRVPGSYQGSICRPQGYEQADISAAPTFQQLCQAQIPSCGRGCWAGGDTGGWF